MNDKTDIQRRCVRIVDAVAVLVAAFVVTVRPLFSGNASPLHRNINLYLLVLAAMLLVGLVWVLRKRIELPSPLLCLLLLTFIATSILTSLGAGYRCAALIRTLDIVAWALGLVLMVQVFRTPFRGRVLLAALVATLAVMAAHGIYQHFVALPDLRANLDTHVRNLIETGRFPADLVDTFRKRAESGDVWGTFVLSNNFAGYLILLVPLTLVLVWTYARRRDALNRVAAGLLGLVAAASVWTLWLTRSKGGILAFVVAIIIGIVWLFGRRLFTKRVAAAAAVFLVAILLTAQKPPDTTADAARTRLMSTPLGASAEVRLEYWKAGWAVFKGHPILGVGPGNFREHYITHRTPEGSETKYAHNDYLEVAVEQGIVGLSAYLGVWIVWLLAMRRRRVRFDEEDPSPSGRRTFAIVVGVAGALSVAYAMSAYTSTFETRMMWLTGTVIWLGVYIVQASPLVRDGEAPSDRGPLRWAVTVGVVAFLVHSAIDFDFDVPGLTRTLAALMATGLALRAGGAERAARRIGSAGQVAVAAATVVPAALVLIFVLTPLARMSIDLQQARGAAYETAAKRRQAEAARKRRDKETFQRLRAEGGKAFDRQVRHLHDAIARWPGSVEPYIELANLESSALRFGPKTDRRELESLLDAVKRLRPQEPMPYKMMSEVLRHEAEAAERRGETSRASSLHEASESEMAEAVARYPTHPLLRKMHAETLASLKRPAEAAAEYERALHFAERTSEKELKFKPEDAAEIRRMIERLSSARQ